VAILINIIYINWNVDPETKTPKVLIKGHTRTEAAAAAFSILSRIKY